MSLLLALQGGAAPEVITADKWYSALSEPRRARAPTFVPASDFVPFVAGEIVTVDKWLSRFADPTRVVRPLNGGHFAFQPTPVVPFGWAAALSQPARQPLKGRGESFFVPAPAAPLDWLAPFTAPRIRPVSARSIDQCLVYAPPVEVSLDWLWPWSNPSRSPKPGQQQALAYGEPIEFVALDKWFGPLSIPVRLRPGLLPALQQALAFIYPIAPEDITLDKWFMALSEPVRLPPALLAALQQALLYIGADPFPEAVSVDRWLQPLSMPARLSLAGLLPAAQQFYSTDTETPATPVPPTPVGQFTVSGEQVIDRFTHDGVTYTYAAITRRTN